MKSISIGGKEYRLEFDINSGCDMEDKAGRAFGEIINQVVGRNDLRSVRVMVWGGLRKHYPDMTLEDAAELIKAHGNWPELTAMCIDEMRASGFFGKAVEVPPKQTKSKKASAQSTQG